MLGASFTELAAEVESVDAVEMALLLLRGGSFLNK
jgi:hypothetical protein